MCRAWNLKIVGDRLSLKRADLCKRFCPLGPHRVAAFAAFLCHAGTRGLVCHIYRLASFGIGRGPTRFPSLERVPEARANDAAHIAYQIWLNMGDYAKGAFRRWQLEAAQHAGQCSCGENS